MSDNVEESGSLIKRVPTPDRPTLSRPTPKPLPPPKGSLRRRVLWILLAVATVPGYIALILLWLTVSQTLNSQARDETYERARMLALNLDRMINLEIANLGQFAARERVATAIREAHKQKDLGLVDDVSPFPETELPVPPEFEGVPLYVIDQKGRVIAEVEPDRLLYEFERPTDFVGSPAGQRMRRSLPPGPFVAEMSTMDWENPELALLVPLEATAESRDRMFLLAVVPLHPLFERLEDTNNVLGQRLIVVSKLNGVIYATQNDRDLHLAINSLRGTFFGTPTPQARNELVPLEVRTARLGIAPVDCRSISALTSSEEVISAKWAILQTVDLNEFMASVDPMLWTSLIVALVLTIVAIFISIWVSGKMVHPILRLTEGMQRFARGDLDYRVAVRTGDELETLAMASNEMASSLRGLYEDLANRMLELDENAQQLELIHGISYSINRVLDLEKLFRRIIRELLKQIPCERISLALKNSPPEAKSPAKVA